MKLSGGTLLTQVGRDEVREQTPERKSPNLPAYFVASVDPREFKLCCVLMDAAYTGKMPISNPSGDGRFVGHTDEIEIRLRDVPLNKGLNAVYTHYRKTRMDRNTRHREFQAMAARLVEFGKFVRKCLRDENPRITRYVQIVGKGIKRIEPAFAEAAATVRFDVGGFDVSSMFAIADALSSQEMPMYRTIFLLTDEQRANHGPKKNANGGRPPNSASPEQLAEWRKDMERRKYLRRGEQLPPELRRARQLGS